MKRQFERVYTMRRPDYQEQRTGKTLLVWSDIPHWVAVDDELRALLADLDGRRPLHQILAAHPEWVDMREDIVRAVAALEKAGVVSAGDRPEGIVPQKPEPVLIENVALNITRRCNLKCRFCYNQGFPSHDPGEELSADEIVRFLHILRPLLAKKPSLTILGGEPLLRADDLLEVCARSRTRFSTLVSTNGTLVTDSFARQAAMIGLRVQVSLDGHTAVLHDSVRGAGAFDLTPGGIKTLVSNGVHTIISMVCHAGNLAHLENFFDLAVSLGAHEARFIPLKRIGGGISGGFTPVGTKELMLASFDLFKRRPELLKLAGRDAFSIIASTCRQSVRKMSCGTGLQTFLLDSDGSIYPCLNTNLPEFRLGSIRDPGFDFAAMWRQSESLRNYRKQTAVSESDGACYGCIVRHWCVGGCRGETYVTTGTIEGKPPDCANLREAIIGMMWMIADIPDLTRATTTA